MPDQFVVPQFIDAEDKIIGPITVRQFIILLVIALAEAALWKLLPFLPFIIVGVIILVAGAILAFARINGMPFHFFLLNLMQTLKRPGLRVWNKEKTDSELKAYMAKEAVMPEVAEQRKKPPAGSRLRELTLVVDTGGIYRPEGEEE